LYGKPDAPELFLKHGKGSVANDVTDEMVRLNWLTAFMPLPTIKHFIRTPYDAWLLTTAIPGKTAFPFTPATQVELKRYISPADMLRVTLLAHPAPATPCVDRLYFPATIALTVAENVYVLPAVSVAVPPIPLSDVFAPGTTRTPYEP
jgi:hypothetical protein